MAFDPELHHRRSIRLKGYDYTREGAYLVTLVTQNRACLFGDVVDSQMRLNAAGQMVAAEWDALPTRFPTVALDAFIVMPNHAHGIMVMTHHPAVGAGLVPAQTSIPTQTSQGATTRVAVVKEMQPPETVGRTVATVQGATTRVAPTGVFAVGDVVGAWKSLTTVAYARGVKRAAWPPFHRRLWQRNYYEHVIRHEESLNRIRQYILDNPARWVLDRENPVAEEPEPEDAWSA